MKFYVNHFLASVGVRFRLALVELEWMVEISLLGARLARKISIEGCSGGDPSMSKSVSHSTEGGV